MAQGDGYVLDTFRDVAVISESHGVTLVQNTASGKFYVKKVLSEYTRSIYDWLMENPVPGMPKIIDTAEKDGILYVIEEYVSGETLEERLGREGKLSADEAARIMAALCRTVSCLHEAKPPVIHRDIKPSNIILTDGGTVKLLDMNAAKRYAEGESRDTRLIGTVGYAAPEQFGFEQSDVRTDIYSLGVLLNVMLTGSMPTERKAGGAMGDIVSKCTEMSPRDRYSSADSLKADVMEAAGMNVSRIPRKKFMRFLPPGFRTLNPFHMAPMAFVYFVVVFLTTCTTYGTARNQIACRAVMLLMFLSEIFFFGNWLGIQDRLPLSGSRNIWVKFLGCLIYAGTILLFFVILLVFC